MKITIKDIIKENKDIDSKQRFINGIVNIIRLPYFKFLEVNEVPRELWNDIFSKLFKQKVKIYNNVIYDSNNNNIYSETSYGYWEMYKYDENDNYIIYFENSIGYWEKREYDKNNNQIYYENSDGYIMDNRPISSINENIDPKQRYINKVSEILNPPYFRNLGLYDVPRELWNDIFSKVFNTKVTYGNNNVIYDNNGNKIYYENSIGYWFKYEYDENNNEIYYENSNGTIRGNRSSSSINENIDTKQKFINGIVNIIRPPYFYSLEVNEVPRELWVDVLSKVFNTKVTYSNNRLYDENNNEIYYEDSDGYWVKREYDKNNNEIYYEDSDGYWVKREFDSNNNEIYYENSDGNWSKYEFDKNNNQIYYENSDGYWVKREFDSNNNRIYYEDSDGDIMDNRPSNPINENNTI